MECIYYKDLVVKHDIIDIKGESAKHCRALRLRPGEKLMITDGCGVSYTTCLIKFDRDSYKFNVINNHTNLGEFDFRFGLALGILDNKDRFEFALEKSIELGITDFYPLICDHSQKKSCNYDRLLSKSISAMEQCKRSIITIIHSPIYIHDLLSGHNFDRIILSDEDGLRLLPENNSLSTLIFVGPEGGFSEKEIEIIRSTDKCFPLNLGNRRLRAETAAIMAVGSVSLQH